MKKSAYLLLAIAFLFVTDLFAYNTTEAANAEATTCIWNSWFKYPQANAYYDEGKDIYVKVDPQNYHHIAFMELYIDNRFVRRETSYPFEWGRPNGGGDHYLRNMKPGTYKLKVKIKDKCGYYHEKYITIHVKPKLYVCHFTNPIHDLHWLKDLKYKHPDYAICEYKKNGKTFFRVYKTGVSHFTEYWYDCTGYLVCSFLNGYPPCYEVAHAQLIKCWYNCTGDHVHGYCDFTYWFKYPEANKEYYKGDDVYIKVEADKYQHIEYVDLYVEGQFVRKETSFPYEWGRPNTTGDHILRNMQPGTYKIKIKIKDKCGKFHEKYCTIIVKDKYPVYCKFQYWFKYPEANKYYYKGDDIHVKVEVDKYQEIEYMDLYIDDKFVRKETSFPYEWGRPNSGGDQYLRNMHPGTYKIKIKIKDKCGYFHEKYIIVHVKDQHIVYCNFNAWFKYPQPNKYFYKGQDAYVKVEVDKYQDIEYMELYVNGHFVRKETSFPYEWGRPNSGGDYKLRNLNVGPYNLKVRIKDKCGKFHEKYFTFHVKHGPS